MDILVIEDSSKVIYGGGQRVTKMTINALSNNHKIFLVDFKNDSYVYRNSATQISSFLSLKSFGKVSGNRSSYNIGILELLIFPLIFFYNLPALLIWFRKIGSPPVIYCATKKALLYGAFLKFLKGGRLLFHCHHVSPSNSFFAKLFDRWICVVSDLIICVSKYVTLQFPNCKNLTVIYNYSDITSRSTGRSIHGEIRVGFVGNILPLKGIELFFKIAKTFQNNPDFKFIIYGKNLINIDIPNQIEYKGFCSRDEIYNSIDILLACPLEPEAFSLTPLEAQSFGIPVIAPRFGSFPESIDHEISGFLYSLPEEIENYIVKLSDQDTYQNFSKKALDKKQVFDKNVFDKKINEVF